MARHGRFLLAFILFWGSVGADPTFKETKVDLTPDQIAESRHQAHLIYQAYCNAQVDGYLKQVKASAEETKKAKGICSQLKESDLVLQKQSPMLTLEEDKKSIFPSGTPGKPCVQCEVEAREKEAQKNSSVGALPDFKIKSEDEKTGAIFLTWTYNRTDYLSSKTHIWSDDGTTDFTIQDMKAKDRPTAFDWVYLVNFTVPQYNVVFGYLFKSGKFGIQMGMDHMKYVMVNDQYATVSGHYKDRNFDPNEQTKIDFMRYEHTNGYNFASVGFIWNNTFLKSKSEKFSLSWFNTLSAGLFIPKTDVSMKGYGSDPNEWLRRDNVFAVRGAGVKLETGLKAEFKVAGKVNFIFQSIVDGNIGSLHNILMNTDALHAEQPLIVSIERKPITGGISIDVGKKKGPKKPPSTH